MNSVRPSSASNMEFLTLHPFVRQTVIDKARGVIVGSALGDCIGLYTGRYGMWFRESNHGAY